MTGKCKKVDSEKSGMNVFAALRGKKSKQGDPIDVLAEEILSDRQLAAQTEVVIRRGLKWQVPELGEDSQAVLVVDRGGRETYAVRDAKGNYLIEGEDKALHPITREHVGAMALLGLERTRLAEGRVRRERE